MADPTVVTGEYTQDFVDLKELLQFQNDYITELKAKDLKSEKDAAAIAEKIAAKEAAADEYSETTLEALNKISSNTKDTAAQLLATSEQIATLETKVATLEEGQGHMQTTIVEGGWIVAVTIAVAIGLKVFWDNTLKW